MNPAGSNVVLLRSKENIAGCNCAVFNPELTPIELYHCDDNSIGTDDLTASEALTGSNFFDGPLIPYHNKFYRLMTEGSRGCQSNLHDLFDHSIINMFICISAHRAPSCRQFKQFVFHYCFTPYRRPLPYS